MADFVLDPGEEVVERINRYAIELVWPIIIAIILIILVIFGLNVFFNVHAPGDLLDFIPANIVLILAAALVIIAGLIVLAAVYVLEHNYILVTNMHIIKVQQSGLLARQTSELGLGNIEDVKGGRKGLFGTLFDYGDLEIQTAGASENFIFRSARHPQLTADKLLEYKADFRRSHHMEP